MKEAARGKVHLRLFGCLYTLRRQRGLPVSCEVTVPPEGRVALDIAEDLGLPTERIEAVFRNGLIQGIHDPERIRALIMSRLRESRTAGLGDDELEAPPVSGWSPRHLAVLREIRDALASIPA